MEHICLNAHAKVNLALDIVGKRPDGYHNLETIMQTLYLHDDVFIKKTASPGIRVNCNLRWLPVDSRNLVYKAARSLYGYMPKGAGVYIDLTKNIPVSAGLAGGSADCAATLLGIRQLFGIPVSDAELAAIGRELGADVPFCLVGGTALARGIGDELTPLRGHPKTIVALAKPSRAHVSTAAVFGRFSAEKVTRRPDIDRMAEDIENQRVERVAQGFCNVLETVTEPMHPVITDLKRMMLQAGAMNAVMSGSGPSVFGYFSQKRDAIKAIRLIKNTAQTACGLFLTSTYCPPKGHLNTKLYTRRHL